MARALNRGWVLGISLDDRIEFCACPYERRSGELTKLASKGRIFGRPVIPAEGRLIQSTSFQDRVRAELKQFLNANKQVRDEISMVGISAVGSTSRSQMAVFDVAISDWGRPKKKPVLSVRRLLADLLPQISNDIVKNRVHIQNESTAKCLAEWKIRKEPCTSLLYVLFCKGVNAGFVLDGRPITANQLNTEFGHIYPRVHNYDLNFNPQHSGCRLHGQCFEGLASARRIRESWADGQDRPLSSLPIEPAWDVIAFYMAQLCLNGVLAFAPHRVVLGGSTVFEGLVPHVRAYFRALLNGGDITHGEGYPLYRVMRPIDEFITMAQIGAEEAGVEAALELARMAIDDPSCLKTADPHMKVVS